MIPAFLLLTTLCWVSPFNLDTTWLPWNKPENKPEIERIEPLDTFLEEQEAPWKAAQEKELEKDGEDWWLLHNLQSKMPPELIAQVKSIAKSYLEKNRQLKALDIGCGIQSPLTQLLTSGWSVTFLDSSNSSLDILQQSIEDAAKNSLLASPVIIKENIESFVWPLDSLGTEIKYDLIVAWDVLSFCSPKKIRKIWNDIYNHLEEGGYFIGSVSTHQPNSSSNAWSIGSKENIETLFKATKTPARVFTIEENLPWMENSALIIIQK